ncbi:MAG: hypothetical protein ACLQIB_01575 [Isosphaeraceae bacterium]
MPRFKFSVSQRRRALAKKVDQLDRLESKVTITEPISVMGVWTGTRASPRPTPNP